LKREHVGTTHKRMSTNHYTFEPSLPYQLGNRLPRDTAKLGGLCL